jgi:hypothetical protein
MSAEGAEGFAASLDAFHEQARSAAGLDDFGDPAYLEGLRVLLESLDEDENLSEMGAAIFRNEIVKTLATRLRVERRLQKASAVPGNNVRRPIIVTGLVRTGSTALHYLMGQDPGLQKLEYWLSAEPQPRPPRAEWEEHPDFQASKAELEFLYRVTPSLMAVHEMHPDWPEECRHILAQSFTDDRFECSATLPRYFEWYRGTPHPETYTRHRKVIELIGSTDPQRRWLLKYPVHLRQLPALFDVYPDACIVQTHRDPRTVIASYASFLSKIRAVHEKSVDLEAIAREQMESWAHAAEAGMAARRQRGSEAFFDLHFPDFMADPIGSVRRIYAHFDQELSPEGERKLQAWRAAHPQGKHGAHQYEKQEIGVDEGEILDRFAGYMEFFQLQA